MQKPPIVLTLQERCCQASGPCCKDEPTDADLLEEIEDEDRAKQELINATRPFLGFFSVPAKPPAGGELSRENLKVFRVCLT